jgi:hypothetical protein
MNCKDCVNLIRVEQNRNGKIIVLHSCKGERRYISKKFFDKLPLKCGGYKGVEK